MSNATQTKRIRYQDTKPYSYAASLDELHGPSSGTVTLPHWVYWAPGSKTLSLDTSEKMTIYQAVLAEGTEDDICTILNKDLLIDLWPTLNLPIPVARGWEKCFPELCGNMRATW